MSSKRRSGPAGSPEDYPDTPDPKRRKRNDVSAIANSHYLCPLQPSPTQPNQLNFCRTHNASSPAQ